MPDIVIRVLECPKLPLWLKGAAKIFVMALAYGLWDAYRHGEMASWGAIVEGLKDGLLPAAGATLAWLRMTHPDTVAKLESQAAEISQLRGDAGSEPRPKQ